MPRLRSALLALALAVPVANPAAGDLWPRIIPPSTNDNGTPAANATVYTLLELACTGTLIREDLVLSAGHCAPPSFDDQGVPSGVWNRVEDWYPGRFWRVQIGRDKTAPLDVVRVTHFSSAFHNDIVLLALERPVDRSLAIPAPPLLADAPVDWPHETFTLVGWGATDPGGTVFPDIRQRATVTGADFPCSGNPNKICLRGVSQVRGGDSGGPLYWRDDAGRRFVIGELQNTGSEYYATFGPGAGDPASIANFLDGLLSGPNPNAVLADNCLTGNRPGASLLIPYFEVDLDDPAGTDTLVSIQNRSAERIQTHVVLWTDWGKPTLGFDLQLAPLASKTISLRFPLQSGAPPVAEGAPGCPNPVSTGTFLRAAHTGAPTALGCFSAAHAGVATGYLTVDTVRVGSCPDSSDREPWDPDYFAETSERRATDQNVLAGDFALVIGDENFAQGFDGVPIVADPTRFSVGSSSYSFWGRFVDFEGRDHRAPLSDSWTARYGQGGTFDGGTQLLVWREVPGGEHSVLPDSCAGAPAWFPLGERGLSQRAESGAPGASFVSPQFFSLATQRVSVATLSPTFTFGTLFLDLGRGNGDTAQAWVGWSLAALGRYSVGVSGVPTHDLCDPLGTIIGAPGGLTVAEEE